MQLDRFDVFAITLIICLISISLYRHRKEAHKQQTLSKGLGIRELISQVKAELVETETKRITENKGALFQLKDFDLEIKFLINKKIESNGKFDYQIVTVGSNSSISTEKVQTIKLHMQTTLPEEDSIQGNQNIYEEEN